MLRRIAQTTFDDFDIVVELNQPIQVTIQNPTTLLREIHAPQPARSTDQPVRAIEGSAKSAVPSQDSRAAPRTRPCRVTYGATA
jgi:hypothetical protein